MTNPPPAEAIPPILCRPTSLDPQELGFTPQRPVTWLAPGLLLRTGLRALLANLFGAYLDKRELQNALPGDIHRHDGPGEELWLDYVADLGDGFDSTYTVAWLLAQPELRIDGHRLPRGQVLMMGGDEVYPAASMSAYKDRMKGPYAAALPAPPARGPRPTLYAIPGNHDWYDGLTSFLRLFVRIRTDNIGGWRVEQSRSYFAVALPANWWLFAIDEQSGSYLDDPQLLYFARAASKLRPHHRVILAVPAPNWVKAINAPEAYDTIDFFLRTVIAPTGAQVRLIVSGDLHHYSRYSGPDRELITCGTGGAYLYPTHKLPEQLSVPPTDTLTRKASRGRQYDLAARYPNQSTSRAYAWQVFRWMPQRNPGFASLIGAVHMLLMLAMLGVRTSGDVSDWSAQRLFSIPLGIMVVAVLLATVLFAQPPSATRQRQTRHAVLGVGHGLAHIALAFAGMLVWSTLPVTQWPWPLPLVASVLVYLPVMGIIATELVALYLLVASEFRVNLNELFAGQGIDDAKGFLRMHIAADGTLTVYPVAVDRVARQWEARPDDPVGAPWVAPQAPPALRFMEAPIVLRP